MLSSQTAALIFRLCSSLIVCSASWKLLRVAQAYQGRTDFHARRPPELASEPAELGSEPAELASEPAELA